MPSPLAAHLADRFAADARGLRARGAALARAPRGGGPNAANYARMADACDRVQALFEEAADTTVDDDALRALLPRVAGMVAGARSPDERNVYAGAVARLTEGLAGGDEGDEDADQDEDDA
ncbi:MAG TPA: hypothetical protein VGD56_22460 [Gemmatirosa sp.]